MSTSTTVSSSVPTQPLQNRAAPTAHQILQALNNRAISDESVWLSFWRLRRQRQGGERDVLQQRGMLHTLLSYYRQAILPTADENTVGLEFSGLPLSKIAYTCIKLEEIESRLVKTRAQEKENETDQKSSGRNAETQSSTMIPRWLSEGTRAAQRCNGGGEKKDWSLYKSGWNQKSHCCA